MVVLRFHPVASLSTSEENQLSKTWHHSNGSSSSSSVCHRGVDGGQHHRCHGHLQQQCFFLSSSADAEVGPFPSLAARRTGTTPVGPRIFVRQAVPEGYVYIRLPPCGYERERRDCSYCCCVVAHGSLHAVQSTAVPLSYCCSSSLQYRTSTVLHKAKSYLQSSCTRLSAHVASSIHGGLMPSLNPSALLAVRTFLAQQSTAVPRSSRYRIP